MRRTLLGLVVPALVTVPLAVAGSPASGASAPGAPVSGTSCRVFPANSFWHADVRRLPVHPRSAAWLSHMSTDRDLHPDFGPAGGTGPDYGMPVTVVGAGHGRVAVRFGYADESDRVRYPFGSDTRIEGGRSSGGDMHAIVVDRSRCRLFETWATEEHGGRWSAGSGATWSLRSNALRPDGWTSADAAGLPILPGLLRWNEVQKGSVDHAVRFTTDVTSRHHVWPARHDAGSTDSRDVPPMGARFRLRSSYRPTGLVLADNGSPWFFQGERNAHWPDRMIADLKRIPARAFVAVDTRPLRASANSSAVR